jgi:hypothetical protein
MRWHVDPVYRATGGRVLPFALTLTPIGEVDQDVAQDVYAQDLLDTFLFQMLLMMGETGFNEETASRIWMDVQANSTNGMGDGSNFMAHSRWHPADLLAQNLLEFAESIQTSGGGDLTTLSWTFIFEPGSFFQGGAVDVKIPKQLDKRLTKKSIERVSWRAYKYEEHPITCAAFALIWNESTSYQRTPSRFKILLKRAYRLQVEMKWGPMVSLHDLKRYTEKFPQTRIIVFTPQLKKYDDRFRIQHVSWLNGKTVYLFWDAGIFILYRSTSLWFSHTCENLCKSRFCFIK